MNEKSKWLLVLTLLAVLPLSVPPVQAQNASQVLSVRPGETFSISHPVNSSFHSWELESYDVRKLSLKLKQSADTIGNYRFVFQALENGQVTITLTKTLNTALTSETIDEHTVTVSIEERPEQPEPSPDEPEESPPPDTQETTETVTESESAPPPDQHDPDQGPPGVDQTAWNRAEELIETGNFQEARNIIDEQIQDAAGEKRQSWMELKARSFREEQNYDGALEVYRSMLDQFQDGPKAKWLHAIADINMQQDQPDQARLSYLEIRHRYPDSSQWPSTMINLAKLALDNNNVKRARRLLERARSRVNVRNHPEILMNLAEIYDRFSSVRDYPRAVELYERAASVFDDSDTQAQAATDRAEYLKKNFLEFGTE
ncbi:MAG: tol-pal system YbgF family protein [bacterium]